MLMTKGMMRMVVALKELIKITQMKKGKNASRQDRIRKKILSKIRENKGNRKDRIKLQGKLILRIRSTMIKMEKSSNLRITHLSNKTNQIKPRFLQIQLEKHPKMSALLLQTRRAPQIPISPLTCSI